MAELTIQIPYELALRLQPPRNRLPELLSQILNSTNPSLASLAIALETWASSKYFRAIPRSTPHEPPSPTPQNAPINNPASGS